MKTVTFVISALLMFFSFSIEAQNHHEEHHGQHQRGPRERMNPEQMIPSQPNDTNKPDNRMDNPETGDGSNLTLPIIILSVSGIGLSGIFIYLRKRKCNR